MRLGLAQAKQLQGIVVCVCPCILYASVWKTDKTKYCAYVPNTEEFLHSIHSSYIC